MSFVTEPVVFGEDEQLTAPELLPGFSVQVGSLF